MTKEFASLWLPCPSPGTRSARWSGSATGACGYAEIQLSHVKENSVPLYRQKKLLIKVYLTVFFWYNVLLVKVKANLFFHLGKMYKSKIYKSKIFQNS